MSRATIVVDIGANHNGDLQTAKHLVAAAASCGADIVKFQSYTAESLYSKFTPSFAGISDIRAMIKKCELPFSWLSELKSLCEDHDVEFMSTPFDLETIDALYELGVKRLKIAGFEATDPRIVKHAASTGLPLIISFGIGTNTDIAKRIVSEIKDVNKNVDLTILHCNHAYPTPFEDVGLETMLRYVHMFPYQVGLSDHTLGILVSPVAVGLGAVMVEKHFTLNRVQTGPDHSFAIEPNELKEMVKNIRTIETCIRCRPRIMRMSPSEEKFSMAQRSVVALKSINQGDIIDLSNVTTKRPFIPGAVPAGSFYDIIGRRARKCIEEDGIILESDIEQENVPSCL